MTLQEHMAPEEKLIELQNVLSRYERLAVAFSGGVDSTLLLEVAHQQLGSCVLALTAHIPMTSAEEFKAAEEFCEQRGIVMAISDPDVLSVPEVVSNDVDRCYYCKKTLFNSLLKAAHEHEFTIVADGTNCDDMSDYRPGLRALEELNVVSPLRDAGFTKDDVRQVSRLLGLSTWNKQSNACLATRFPYNTRLEESSLRFVDGMETLLIQQGFSPIRVRVHDSIVRLEMSPQQLSAFCSSPVCSDVIARVKEAGYSYVTLDLEGFRSGSMNVGALDKETLHE